MAATGKTPILLYGSSTATNQPSAGNLTNSSDGCEIAINVADKNLFFKDSTNAVNTVPIRQSSTSSNGWLSSTDWNTFNNKSPSNGSASIDTVGTITSGVWHGSIVTVPYGGTGLNTVASGRLLYGTGSTTLNNSASLIFDGTTLNVAGGTFQYTPKIAVRGSTPNQYEWGHSNTGGYGSVIGAENGSGTPFIAFECGGGTNNNTYKTFGIVGSVITGNAGTFTFSKVATANADNQSLTTLATIAAGGDVTVSSGNLVIGTSGKGIDFSATSDGSGTATSELLSDYEEGTWTPSLGGNTTYTSRAGTYTKIGRVVVANFWIQVATLGTGSATTISGLPYTSFATNRGAGSIAYVASQLGTWCFIGPYVPISSATIKFNATNTSGAWTLDASVFTDSTFITGTVTYTV